MQARTLALLLVIAIAVNLEFAVPGYAHEAMRIASVERSASESLLSRRESAQLQVNWTELKKARERIEGFEFVPLHDPRMWDPDWRVPANAC